MHIKYRGQYASDKFISIVICSYQRADMTKALVESIHQHADMPFELIIHDDAGHSATSAEIYRDLKDKVSTFIFSEGGVNLGLATSMERGSSLAGSDYILCLNNDILFLGPGLKDIPKVLDTPYVGIFGPWHIGNDALSPNHVTVDSNGFRFKLGNLCGNGSAMSFRRDLWNEIGGFPITFNGACDTAFMRKVLRAGYFNACYLSKPSEMMDNVDYHAGCARSTLVPPARDLSYPLIFNAPNLSRACKLYEKLVCDETHAGERIDGSMFNDHWWYYYFSENIIAEDNNYRWENLTYHSRFKDIVERDRVAV